MSLERWFRLSSYATLGVSCAALVFAEAPFLPDLQVCLAPVLALLLLAWWLEGRWSLPAWGANLLGGLIAAGGLSWLATQLADDESLLARVAFHLALLPYMGPLLMASLLVKMFRPRDAGDFWRLQGLGLMQVGLGCVLDGGPAFGALLAIYLASALACLALRYRLTTAGEASAFSVVWLLSFTLRWTLLIGVAALLLFLLTPRRDSLAWEPLNDLRSGSNRLHAEAGGSDEINLNGTGRVELDDEIAVRVAAVDAAGQAKLDLPGEQRWRGVVLDWYQNGKWTMMHQMPVNPRRINPHELPDFGPKQFFLTFTVQPRQAGSLVLAEPVRLGPLATRLPIVTLDGESRAPLFSGVPNTLLPLPLSGRREYHYRQVVPILDDSARTPALSLRRGPYLEGLAHLPRHLDPALTNWTVDLLRQLSQKRRYFLPEDVRSALARPQRSFVIAEENWQAVAHVLTEYLAHSGEFTYTLDIARADQSIDPVMDFLVNVKQGHCERYATALALMLRSLGIPARVVKGYRGAESQGDGLYVVRHRHAHAWVEMLVPHRPSAPPLFDWLMLDPTPAESASSVSRFSLARAWQEGQRLARQMWQTLIVDYNADEQADLWDTLRSGQRFAAPWKLGFAVLTVTAFAVGVLVLRRRSQRRPTCGPAGEPPAATAFYQRLLRILARRASLRPSYGQTPREYGEAARVMLQGRPDLARLAELPVRVVDLFYRVRFGGKPLSDGERRALEAELERLAEALRCSRAEPEA
jgi:transglutaminase-like putative cysteine protease/membrane protein implicated in regulation of membrane protease activity